MKRSRGCRPWGSLAIAIVLTGAFAVSGCVYHNRLLSARVEQVPIETKPAEYKGTWPQDSALLRVELRTSRDLRAMAEDHELNVGVDVFLCDSRSHELSAMPYLYDAVGRIDAYHGRGDGLNTIWFYLAQNSRLTRYSTDGPDFFAYDLRVDARDMCIELSGGNMLGQTIRSNRLRVSAKSQPR